jgi:SAM-dependent methyltransferase
MADETYVPKGLFINVPIANCSIYEAGRMIYDCLALSDRYHLDYIEIDEYSRDISNSYDFYAFNYHHYRMSWLDTATVRRLPGLKITFVLETLPNNPFVLCPQENFDAYCALDPTMASLDTRVYAFPRPLETVPSLSSYIEPAVPVVGTFGFATQGKGFELVVEAVNKEFERAIVRINIPRSPYAYKRRWFDQEKDYADHLGELSKKRAKDGISVVVTHDYLTKQQLIHWCAENTLNCFLYSRNIPGLSATTDQAIVSGRPLAISADMTFRHIHHYLRPYPVQSLRESIATSAEGVKEMQRDWSPRNFVLKFERVLKDFGLFTSPHNPPLLPEFIHLEKKQLAVTFAGRSRRRIRKVRFAISDIVESLRPVPRRKTLCKFLLSRSEIHQCTAYLKSHGYFSHRLGCKDWDIANILPDLSDGNLLDMGSSDSFLLKNAVRKGIEGRKYGIDLQRPDVIVEGVTYLVGDLTRTELPDGHLQNITCLSVIEHGIDFDDFSREAIRLLSPGGRLYVTFDYWTPKVLPRMRIFGKAWNILDRNDVEHLVETCSRNGLALVNDVDWSLRKPVINGRNYSPDPSIGYTFGLLTFQKR